MSEPITRAAQYLDGWTETTIRYGLDDVDVLLSPDGTEAYEACACAWDDTTYYVAVYQQDGGHWYRETLDTSASMDEATETIIEAASTREDQ